MTAKRNTEAETAQSIRVIYKNRRPENELRMSLRQWCRDLWSTNKEASRVVTLTK